jgi:drug/metabolite transporter (DMT)-like permease
VSPRAWALFAAVSVLWGVPYLMIKVAVEEVSPVGVVAARTLLAAAILLPLAAGTGALRAVRHRWPELLGLAALEIAVPFTLISAGERHVSSSLTAIVIAAGPFMAAAVGAATGRERVGPWNLVGMAVGLAGVALLVGVDVGGDRDALLGVAMILGAVTCYAVAVIWMRVRFSDLPATGMMAVVCAAAAAMTLPFALASLPGEVPSGEVLWSLAGLGLGCTALALVLYMALISEVGGVRAILITYVNPVVAVIAGVAVLNEPLTGAMVAGMALIAAGSWVATSRPPIPTDAADSTV